MCPNSYKDAVAVVDTFRIDPPPPFTRKALIALLVAFALTRAVGAYVVLRPEGWGPPQTSVSLDFDFYHQRAEAIGGGRTAYREQDLEYPPGSLGLIVLPYAGGSELGDYKVAFVLILMALDAAGLLGLMRLSGRWGSRKGPWLWVVLIAILGPLTYARLDLLSAVMTIWMLERAAAGAWRSSGAWLGAAVFTKIYPLLLLPVAAIMSPKPRELWKGVALGVGIPLIPFVHLIPDMIHDIFGYHTGRGIQIESIYGGGFLVGMRRGASYLIDADFGAYHFNGRAVEALKSASSLITLIVVIISVLIARRLMRREGESTVETMSQVMFATLGATLAVSTVFSPQYVVWLIALGAVAACSRRNTVLVPTLVLIPVAALTQAVFPFLYPGVLSIEATPLFVLFVRNVLVLWLGVAACILVARSAPRSGNDNAAI